MKAVFAMLLWVIAFGAQAANSGESAQHCISVTSGDGKVRFKNDCDAKVFIVWCGDLKYTRQKCGNGPKGGYYTHSSNLDAGRELAVNVEGRYSYGACMGSIGFGNDEFRDDAEGKVTCLGQSPKATAESKASKGSPSSPALLPGAAARAGGG